MKGGKKRKMKGGMSDFLLGPSTNVITSFGTSAGAGSLVGLMSGQPPSTSDPTQQPVMNGKTSFYA